jgi:hypothetical protein
MATTVLLHIGAHKTGTSSVQHFLDTIRPELAAAGWLYPRAARYRFGHHRLAMTARGRSPRRLAGSTSLAEEARRVREEIEASGLTRVIVSSETFFALGQRGAEAVVRAFDGHRLIAAALVRRPDEHFLSIYNQRIKQPKSEFSDPVDGWVERSTELSRDLRPVEALSAWADVLGLENVRVACYEAHPDAVTNVLGLIGLDDPAIVGLPRQRRNVGLSAPGVELLRRAKLAGADQLTRQRLQRVAQRHLAGPQFAGSLLSPEQRIDMLRACDEASEALFRRFIGGECLYRSDRVDPLHLPPARRLDADDIGIVLAGLCRDLALPSETAADDETAVRRIVGLLAAHGEALMASYER